MLPWHGRRRTADAFNAVAEPRRRQILDALAGGERPVNDLVALLGLAQPQVSKHLRVLREVGLVEVRGDGRQRVYRLNAARCARSTTGCGPTSSPGRAVSASSTRCWRN